MTRSEQLHLEAVTAVVEFYHHRGAAFCEAIAIRLRRCENYEQFREIVLEPVLANWAGQLPEAVLAILRAKTRPGAADLLSALDEVPE